MRPILVVLVLTLAGCKFVQLTDAGADVAQLVGRHVVIAIAGSVAPSHGNRVPGSEHRAEDFYLFDFRKPKKSTVENGEDR